VHSTIPLPGALPLSVEGVCTAPDLVIAEGLVPPIGNLQSQHARSGAFRVVGGGVVCEKSGVARFYCDLQGRRITVQTLPGVAAEDVAVYLIANALPAALWMRGDVVLHAAAAVLAGNRRALAFLGPSGSGKSTLLEALLAQGSSIVAEDSLRIRRVDGEAEMSGLPGCLWLRAHGATLDQHRAAREVPRVRCLSAASVAAMVVLTSDPFEADDLIVRLSATQALQTLLRHRHRPAVPRLLGMETSHLLLWATFAQTVPVYSWNLKQRCGTRSFQRLLALSATFSDEQEVSLE
jgi:hypothetical protein